MSVDEVASRLGKNRATVYRYENNDIENLPTTVLEPLAKILETTPAYLMGWSESLYSIVDEFSQLKEQFLCFPHISENTLNTKEISDAIHKIFEMNNAILKTGRVTCLFDEEEAVMGLKFLLSYYHVSRTEYDDEILKSIVTSDVFKDFILNIVDVYNQNAKIKCLKNANADLKEVPEHTQNNTNYINAAHADDYMGAPEELRKLEEDIMDDEDF